MYFSTINHYGILKLLVTLKNIQLIKDIKLKKKKVSGFTYNNKLCW